MLAAAVVGLATGHFWMLLALAALGILVWHYWRLHRILGRLTQRRHVRTPGAGGIWNELDRLLSRSRDETLARKKRLVAMLRAYRAAAAALPDAIVVVERNSQRIVWFNQASHRLLGLDYRATAARRSARAWPAYRCPIGSPAAATPRCCWMRLRRSIPPSACRCA